MSLFFQELVCIGTTKPFGCLVSKLHRQTHVQYAWHPVENYDPFPYSSFQPLWEANHGCNWRSRSPLLGNHKKNELWISIKLKQFLFVLCGSKWSYCVLGGGGVGSKQVVFKSGPKTSWAPPPSDYAPRSTTGFTLAQMHRGDWMVLTLFSSMTCSWSSLTVQLYWHCSIPWHVRGHLWLFIVIITRSWIVICQVMVHSVLLCQ